uniref:Uncharacterized protein n=1 Tax=Echeneis naucrates TaxID=173247 RepID=A0A665TJT0_ECHNA
MTGSPSSSAVLCKPARSPGKAGRSRAPEALSYSNMCFQTEGEREKLEQRHWCPDRTKDI